MCPQRNSLVKSSQACCEKGSCTYRSGLPVHTWATSRPSLPPPLGRRAAGPTCKPRLFSCELLLL